MLTDRRCLRPHRAWPTSLPSNHWRKRILSQSVPQPEHRPIRSRKLSVAFLGGAHESAVGRVNRTAVEMDQRFELVAGCFSRNPETNQQSAARYGVIPSRTYSDLDDLLERESSRIDGIL